MLGRQEVNVTGDEIRDMRLRLGLTQQQLAERVGTVVATIHRWETGKANPSPLAQRALRDLEREHEK